MAGGPGRPRALPHQAPASPGRAAPRSGAGIPHGRRAAAGAVQQDWPGRCEPGLPGPAAGVAGASGVGSTAGPPPRGPPWPPRRRCSSEERRPGLAGRHRGPAPAAALPAIRPAGRPAGQRGLQPAGPARPAGAGPGPPGARLRRGWPLTSGRRNPEEEGGKRQAGGRKERNFFLSLIFL